MTRSVPMSCDFARRTVRKRDGSSQPLDPARIRSAIERAYRAESPSSPNSDAIATFERVLSALNNRPDPLTVESIQDLIETELMLEGKHLVARGFVLYREEHRKSRALKEQKPPVTIRYPDGRRKALDHKVLLNTLSSVLPEAEATSLYHEVLQNIYDGIPEHDLHKCLILTTRSHMEKGPHYDSAAAHLLLKSLKRPPLPEAIREGVSQGRLSKELLLFDLERLSAALKPERNKLFSYIGLQTLVDRYLLPMEEPQTFWMRVAMGLAIEEDDKNLRAEQFYNMLSSLRVVSSTPTLFNSATLHPQLSSCYLSTVDDDLAHIFKVFGDNAQLSKWAGGIGNDWTRVRAMGSIIQGTKGQTQGVIPFLKVANDTCLAVNQGGRRKGTAVAYLEIWHLDFEDFLLLRRNTGDERRRAHDMNTAAWIPDLFMQRVEQGKHWTLFSPVDVPDLHELYGKAFEERYLYHEKHCSQQKRIDARSLWRQLLTMLYETGHPWVTFKDPCNIRSPQDHVGVVHCSNLCTEITLNTSNEETAVCNLASVNLCRHISEGQLDKELLAETISCALRMLDNVIDINYYPTPETKTSNFRHRPVGLGMMGFQDALYQLGISYASEEAVDFADESCELISYFALQSSAKLAAERGRYPSFQGSKWDRGFLPLDTIDLLEQERGQAIEVDRSCRLDWEPVRQLIRAHGLRNSHTMAIAPTATIANITGVSPSIDPAYSHLFAKSNLSGEFTQLNPYLYRELKQLGLWDREMIDDLKYLDGSIQEIQRIPDEIKHRFPTAFEIEPKWLIRCAARRQKWLDQSQSLNLFLKEPDGKTLSEMYQMAWRSGLKTTYYLRSLAATQVEKSTIDINKRAIQPRWMKNHSASSALCSLTDPHCEACQ